MIDFGEWIANNKHALDEDVYGLLNDSFKCFKNDIDRPAYLLAYQGMMQYVRVTILTSSTIPSGYLKAEWENNWLKKLRYDDTWDDTAFNCTQTKEDTAKKKAAVMNIPKEAREKFPFWRQFRNVCAHYKGYELHKAHTLALYSFIEQYLFCLSVEGSQVALNSQFDDFFNPRLTSKHADIQPLLDIIDRDIRDDEFTAFFDEVANSCAKHSSYSFDSRFHEFIHSVLTGCPLRVKNAAIQYLQSNDRWRNDYLEDYPGDVLEVLTGVDKIHNFWYAKLPSMKRKLIILPLMLAADYIPKKDRKEAMLKCLRNAESNALSCYYDGVSEEMSSTLASEGFFDLFYEEFFNPSHTARYKKEICYQTDFYIGIISLIPWDKKYVEHLIAVFSESVYPYTLQERLKDMYNEDADYKAVIDKICKDEGLALPSIIV